MSWQAPRQIYPLDAPGMPMVGNNFLAYAQLKGDTTRISGRGKKRKIAKVDRRLHYLFEQALMRPWSQFPITDKNGIRRQTGFVLGHIWNEDYQSYSDDGRCSVTGPQRADVMLIGKMPGKDEADAGRNFIGRSGECLVRSLRKAGFVNFGNWYITNVLKFPLPDGTDSIPSSYLKECLPLLHMELRMVQPKFILCLGTDASQALLGPGQKVEALDGRVVDHAFPVGRTADDPTQHRCQVMAVSHPARVVRDKSVERAFHRALGRFHKLVNGQRWDRAEEDLDHVAIRSLVQLEQELQRAHLRCGHNHVVAVDAEWEGKHPTDKGAYIRMLQFSWAHKQAVALVMRDDRGKWCFLGDEKHKEPHDIRRRIVHLLAEFFANKRVVGHFLTADMPWFKHFGLDLTQQYRVPLKAKDGVPAWQRTKIEGGADTAILAHALEETAALGLEALTVRFTDAPRYDVPLEKWKKERNLVDKVKKDGSIVRRQKKAEPITGYGNVPETILLPYAAYDADVTRRIWAVLEALLDKDHEGLSSREAFWDGMLAMQGILEIEEEGLLIDRRRVEDLTRLFLGGRDQQAEKIRSWSGWVGEGEQNFNIRSNHQVREWLFGEDFNKYIPKKGETQRLRPKHAKSLHLQPVLDTSKPPKRWEDLVMAGEARDHTASTDKLAMALLKIHNPDYEEHVGWLQGYRFLDQVVKQVLKPPANDPDGGWLVDEDTREYLYKGGIGFFICEDGRVRTHLIPTAETGRMKSSKPNLQNIGQRREDKYGKLIGPEYYGPLRAIFLAKPGHLLVEADYKSAELLGMALMSQDELMIRDAQAGIYPQHDPRYRDIHKMVASAAYGVPFGEVTDAQRGAAKSTAFGTSYGQSPAGVALQAALEGSSLSEKMAAIVQQCLFGRYTELPIYFQACRDRVGVGWIANCWQRRRRAPSFLGRKEQGDIEREFMNFSIQSLVAGLVNRALARLQYWRDEVVGDPKLFRLVLQIHDAIMMEVPYANVERVVREGLPFAMTHIPVFATNLDGERINGPYYFAAETKIMERFGVKLKAEQLAALGIPNPRELEIVLPKVMAD